MHDCKIFNIIVGFVEYMTIKKTLTGINLENMELIERRKKIMKLQSDLIKEKKICGAKLEVNLTQKLKLEKRKLQLIPVTEPPIPTLPQLCSPIMSPTKSPCTLRKVKRSSESISEPSKICKYLYHDQVSDSELLAALGDFDNMK